GEWYSCERCEKRFLRKAGTVQRFCSIACASIGKLPESQRRADVRIDRRAAKKIGKDGEIRFAQDRVGQWWEMRHGRPFTRPTVKHCEECGQPFPCRTSRSRRLCSYACEAKEHSRRQRAKRGGKPGAKHLGSDGYMWVYFPEHPRASA